MNRKEDREPLIINNGGEGSYTYNSDKNQSSTQLKFRKTRRPPQRSFSVFTCVNFFEWIAILLGTFFSVLIGVVPLAFYFFVGRLISDNRDILNNDELARKIKITSIYFLILAGGSAVASFFQDLSFGWAAGRISFKLRRELFFSMTRQDVHFYDTTESGTLLQMIGENCDKIKDVFGAKIGQLFVSIFQFIIGIGVAFWYSWQLTLVMIGAGPILGVFIGFSGFTTNYTTKKNSEWNSKSLTVSQEVISGFRTVKSFSAEDRELSRFMGVRTGVRSLDYLSALFNGLSSGIVLL